MNLRYASILTVATAKKVSSKPGLCETLVLKAMRRILDIRTKVNPNATAMIMYAPWSVSETTA